MKDITSKDDNDNNNEKKNNIYDNIKSKTGQHQVSKITHRKFWSGTLREERCGITVISTKLLIVNYQIKKLLGLFHPNSQ